jgi:hypothetical protein
MTANPFKSTAMRAAYDASITNARNGCYRNKDGSPCYGSSHATAFWNGFDGIVTAYNNPDDRAYQGIP